MLLPVYRPWHQTPKVFTALCSRKTSVKANRKDCCLAELNIFKVLVTPVTVGMCRPKRAAFLAFLLLAAVADSSRPFHTAASSNCTTHCVSSRNALPRPTHAGYLPIHADLKSYMYYAYFEAAEDVIPFQQRPILLWLQVSSI